MENPNHHLGGVDAEQSQAETQTSTPSLYHRGEDLPTTTTKLPFILWVGRVRVRRGWGQKNSVILLGWVLHRSFRINNPTTAIRRTEKGPNAENYQLEWQTRDRVVLRCSPAHATDKDSFSRHPSSMTEQQKRTRVPCYSPEESSN